MPVNNVTMFDREFHMVGTAQRKAWRAKVVLCSCVPVSATASRQHLRSAASHQLVVPSYSLSS